jgi:hypothetical protein
MGRIRANRKVSTWPNNRLSGRVVLNQAFLLVNWIELFRILLAIHLRRVLCHRNSGCVLGRVPPIRGPIASLFDKNSTLRIMPLSWSASEYLLDQAKKGKI